MRIGKVRQSDCKLYILFDSMTILTFLIHIDSLYVHFWKHSVVPISSVGIVLSFCSKLLKLKTKWQHDPPDSKELRPLLVRYVFRDCELQSASRSHDEGPQKQEMMEGTSAVRAFCWLIYRLGPMVSVIFRDPLIMDPIKGSHYWGYLKIPVIWAPMTRNNFLIVMHIIQI